MLRKAPGWICPRAVDVFPSGRPPDSYVCLQISYLVSVTVSSTPGVSNHAPPKRCLIAMPDGVVL
jgi:hypothetical protein